MKNLLHNWKSYLMSEDLGHYNVDGKIRLYHYSGAEDDSFTLDPEYFSSRGASFTRRDREASDLPRVFFYTNLDHAESIVKSGRSLYSAFVDVSKIYDLIKDPEGLLQKSRPYPEINRPDIDKALRALANKPKTHAGGETKSIRDTNKEPYSGVFYRAGGIDMVVWFKPIEVYKFNPEDVSSPMDNIENK